jgi:hypothetical protein
MIKRINFTRKYLKFINSDNEIITVDPTEYGYPEIISFLEVKDGIICVFVYGRPDEMDLEKRRRNVKKIDESGKELWTISDPLNTWRIILQGDPKKIDILKKSVFNNIYVDKEDRILLYDGSGAYFFLNIYTGEIVYWHSVRF